MLLKSTTLIAILGTLSVAASPITEQRSVPATVLDLGDTANLAERQGGGYRCPSHKWCAGTCLTESQSCCWNEGSTSEYTLPLEGEASRVLTAVYFCGNYWRCDPNDKYRCLTS